MSIYTGKSMADVAVASPPSDRKIDRLAPFIRLSNSVCRLDMYLLTSGLT